ncbi:uncharacterized protein A4U43_C03F12050 [Asparagus officinalis]|uniref:Histidine-containing phosphotransfer protein n=1 Tax=Asparagus officinalis TaxID=4686 RepID=A0A5P1F9D3_ASPOF|nr:uncharacterized protein A4U43_C03F12050 [Asparagus officinalis]
MESASLKAELEANLEYMIEEKLVNECYLDVGSLQSPACSNIFDQSLSDAYEESVELMNKLNELFSNNADLDYPEIEDAASKLHMCMARIGSEKMSHAATVLRHFAWLSNKERCLNAFAEVRQKYNTLQSDLERVVELFDLIMKAEAEGK